MKSFVTGIRKYVNVYVNVNFCFRYQEKLRVHALRVMAVVEKTMHRIDAEDKAAKVITTVNVRNVKQSKCSLAKLQNFKVVNRQQRTKM